MITGMVVVLWVEREDDMLPRARLQLCEVGIQLSMVCD